MMTDAADDAVIVDEIDDSACDLTRKLLDTRTWTRLKMLVIDKVLSLSDEEERDTLLAFIQKNWSAHAPREIEVGSTTSAVTRLRNEVSKMKKLLMIPTK